MKRDCPWRAIAKALASNDRKWTFELTDHHEHQNYPMPLDGEPFFSKYRFTQEHKEFIASYLDRPQIPSRELAIDLRLRFPDNVFTTKQLRNARTALARRLEAVVRRFRS